MEKKHPINEILESSMESLRQMVDVNTIIGDPIHTPDGTIIIPVSKVTFGFGSGGSDFPTQKPGEMFGGGSGGGATIQPLAFLVVRGEGVQLLQLASNNNTAERALNMMPDMVDKISGLFSKGSKASPVSGATASTDEPDPIPKSATDTSL